MTPAMVAVDLGAESCRVSLLRWSETGPRITLVHRIPNGPVAHGDQLRWDLQAIWAGVEEGLRRCAAIAIEGIASIGVDGWATDYVRLNENGRAQGVWTHMMQAGEEFLKSSLAERTRFHKNATAVTRSVMPHSPLPHKNTRPSETTSVLYQ